MRRGKYSVRKKEKGNIAGHSQEKVKVQIAQSQIPVLLMPSDIMQAVTYAWNLLTLGGIFTFLRCRAKNLMCS